MNRVVHFELGAVDPARAVEFYKRVFGWEGPKWGAEEYWLMKTGASPEPGIDGAILRNKDAQPRTVNSIQVSSIDEYAGKVEQHGGQVVVPKMAVPTVGCLAYCKDTEGTCSGFFNPTTPRNDPHVVVCETASVITRTSASGPSAPTT